MFKSILIKMARGVMSRALKDPELWEAYHTNIAMCIYDNRRKDGRLNRLNCSAVAEKVIFLFFDS